MTEIEFLKEQIAKAEYRIGTLEVRLEAYHDQLKTALEHDRQFQLKATWGIVNTAIGIVAFFLAFSLADKLGMEGWLLGIIAAFIALLAFAFASAWSDKGREGDVKKLSRLPNWEEQCCLHQKNRSTLGA